MHTPSSSRKWKTLLHKVEYLRLELEDRNEKVKDWERELNSQLTGPEDYDVPEEPPFPEGADVEVIDTTADDVKPDDVLPGAGGSQEERPDSMRKLWRQVASKTHPDKTNSDPELTDLYKKANSAWEKGELDILLDVALELRIPMDEPDEVTIMMLERRAEQLSKEIYQIESSVLWAWGTADEGKRCAIKDVVKQNRKARRAAEAAARRAK